MPDRSTLWQTAPYPQALEDIAKKVAYKTWALNVDFYDRETAGEGLTLRIRFPAPDSREPEGPVIFWIHDFEVPARTLSREAWQEWVFDCIMLAERHEAMEAFRVDGKQVFFPAHDAESDMYKTKHVVHRRQIG